MPSAKKGRRPDQLPPGRHGLDPQFVAESQRQRILSAVIETVAELGYEQTRVTDIIARAGVSRRTFYDHFDEKEQCFLAAYDIEVALFTEAAAAAYEGDGPRPWPQQVRDGVRALLRHLSEREAAARVCIVDVAAAGAEARAKRDAAVRGFTYFVDAGRGVAKQEVPGRTALAVIGGVLEMISQELVYGSPKQLERLSPDAVYMVLLPFLGPAKAFQERERTRRQLESES